MNKSFLQSKTLWGVAIAALPTVLGMLGFQIGDVAGFTVGANELVDQLVTLVGSALAIYGRFKATTALVAKK